eukprot:7223193-Alexandrium_andersonii.AAC.1
MDARPPNGQRQDLLGRRGAGEAAVAQDRGGELRLVGLNPGGEASAGLDSLQTDGWRTGSLCPRWVALTQFCQAP